MSTDLSVSRMAREIPDLIADLGFNDSSSTINEDFNNWSWL